MMKKLITKTMAFLLVFAICSCSEDQKDPQAQNDLSQMNPQSQTQPAPQMGGAPQFPDIDHNLGHSEAELEEISKEFKRYEKAWTFNFDPPPGEIIDGKSNTDSMRQFLPEINDEYYQKTNYLIGIQVSVSVERFIGLGVELDSIISYMKMLMNQEKYPFDINELLFFRDSLEKYLSKLEGFDTLITDEEVRSKRFLRKVGLMVAHEFFLYYIMDENKIDLDYFRMGLADGLKNNEMIYPKEEMRKIEQNYYKVKGFYHHNKEKLRREARTLNTDLGEKFIDEFLKKSDVVTTESGIHYRVITKGSGPSPIMTDAIRFNIKETLVDGREIINTFNSMPLEGPVNAGIRGYAEIFSMMKAGSKFEIVMLPEIAYGDEGMPGSGVPPYSVIHAEIELLMIFKQ